MEGNQRLYEAKQRALEKVASELPFAARRSQKQWTVNPVDVSVYDATKTVTMTVRVRQLTRFRFRFWLMMKLLLLAQWVSPIAMEIQDEG